MGRGKDVMGLLLVGTTDDCLEDNNVTWIIVILLLLSFWLVV